jgi:hypothetical protein
MAYYENKACGMQKCKLYEFLGLTPAINLTIFFCEVNIFLLFDELSQKIIPYFIME